MNWRQWSGYFAVSSYDDFHEPEYHAIRNGAALIDVSPLFKYEIRGRDAEKLVNRLITRNAAKAKVGQVLYVPWCDREGKVIQDGTFQRLSETTFRATAADPTLRWFEANAEAMDVEIEDLSERVGALALQGPRSREILMEISSTDLSGLKYFWITETELGGVPVLLSRTGYTGDLGFEIWVKKDLPLARIDRHRIARRDVRQLRNQIDLREHPSDLRPLDFEPHKRECGPPLFLFL